MKFYSTNGQSNPVSFKDALLTGMPQDKGLYMPESIPDLSSIFKQDNDLTFQEISFLISSEFIDKELSVSQVQDIIEKCITFEAPNYNIFDNVYCLELFYGPTLAFKDFGARFMARCMESFIQSANKEINILVATSGDTGSAVAHGFYDVEGINVIILYPKGKVSNIQEKQLTTLDKNIYVLEIDGTFDDCQKLVKKAFLDKSLKDKINLSSANSINIARLIPQIFYYAYSYLQLENKSLPTVFSVPCGNFGNITAGMIGKNIGIPIYQFIGATNSNDIVPNYLITEKYKPKPSVQTISNAMDVGNPSNLVRIIDLYSDIDSIRSNLLSWSFNDDETSIMISDISKKYDYVMCPHSSIGLLGLLKYMSMQSNHMNNVFLGTAHPGKFSDIVNPIINDTIELPKRLKDVLLLEKKSVELNNDYNEFYDYLLRTFE
ncbi:MAG: threonine synthase [Candidatus Marinimicrobia bacterium]|nr:threonine synthase [Candidatus Neomarinimicrobiota bacterium]|tara:strand:- start:685 stop:1986 length:1302 start_codon:yes stop_codon:yes gene_type:complete